MTDPLPSSATSPRARRNVTVLVLAQAILGAQISMIFTVGGLAGQTLAPNACLATLPISLIVLGSMLTAGPLSAFMQRHGRRAGFVLGVAGGTAGAGAAGLGLYLGSFPLFLLGSLLTGIYMSAQGFYRFAAADTAQGTFQPKAISYVLAGGLVAAILGPQLVKVTAEAMVIPFLGTYLTAIAINIGGVLLFAFLDIPRPPPRDPVHHAGRTRAELLRDPTIAVAIICGMVSYALMNLVMTSTPLAVIGCGFDTGTAADIVTAHVLAMYVPSFFTGHLIARFGARPIMALGLAILAGAGAVALTGVEIERFFAALVLLGIGWNFGFIGATAMLSSAHGPEERGAVQGMNDILVFGGVTLASLASGGLMNCSGGLPQDGWVAVNLAMVPFLALAGAALIWLVLRPGEKG
ncbi:MFS transporter [Rhodovulum sp. YEN HP10]|uniref:MFS transporter n=1 Tax=Rhodovulum sp. HP10 TaxID=3387397 RepID=UPI0039E00914